VFARRAIPLLVLAALLSACGEESPESSANRGVEALRLEEWHEAAAFAEEAAASGGPNAVAMADFVRGNVAFAKCLTAEMQARTPEAEPFAFDVAITYAETARTRWQLAASSRADWPEARRNVERAMLKLADLKRQKAERRRAGRKNARPRPNIVPGATPEDGGPGGPRETETEAVREKLTDAQVLSLFEKLSEKEREKAALRRTHRGARAANVEKDW
jgi:hypothetical protein